VSSFEILLDDYYSAYTYLQLPYFKFMFEEIFFLNFFNAARSKIPMSCGLSGILFSCSSYLTNFAGSFANLLDEVGLANFILVQTLVSIGIDCWISHSR